MAHSLITWNFLYSLKKLFKTYLDVYKKEDTQKEDISKKLVKMFLKLPHILCLMAVNQCINSEASVSVFSTCIILYSIKSISEMAFLLKKSFH